MSALRKDAKKKTKKRAERRAALESPWTLAPVETAREIARALPAARVGAILMYVSVYLVVLAVAHLVERAAHPV